MPTSTSLSLTLPPLSLYVHVPWCVRKCPYCDFNSHTATDELPEAEYLQSLLSDLRAELPFVQGRTLQSIFIGGGTPSLMPGAFYRELLATVQGEIDCSADMEVTLEANPGTFEQARFADYRAAGINRLSIGVQSFSAEQLQALGRIHNPEEAINAVQSARQLGFERLNIDLMHGLPGQSESMALADLQQAVALEPTHLSWYQLTIEPNTEFHSRPPLLPVDDVLWSIQEQGQQYLAEQGFAQYEISAYARSLSDGHKTVQDQARHNLNYWQFGDYLGIGAGAHGKITDLAQGVIERRWKQRQPKAYMQAPTQAKTELIESEALPLEFMMNALRLNAGVPVRMFTERTGCELASIRPQLDEAVALGLLEMTDTQLRPSPQGRLFLNNLLAVFMS